MIQPLRWSTTAAVLVLVFGLSVLSVALAHPGDTVAAWWPAAGVSVCLLLLNRRRRWPAVLGLIALVSGAANLVAGRGVLVASLFGVVNAVEALVVVGVLSSGLRRRPRLETLADCARLLLAVLVGALTVGLLAALVVVTAEDGPFLPSLVSVTASHGASDLVIVSFVLLGLAHQTRLRARPETARDAPVTTAEAVAQTAATLVAFTAVFLPGVYFPLAFTTLPFLVWGALRLAPLYVAGEVVAVSALASVMTLQGWGPFGSLTERGVSDQAVGALLQTYLAVLVLVTLPLSLGSEQRRQALIEAQSATDLYRRGIRESLVGMMLLRPGPGELVVVDVNEPAATLVGSTPDRLRGRPWTDGLDEGDARVVRAVAEDLRSGSSGHWEREMRLVGHQPHWVRVALSWVPDTPDGGLVTAQFVDLTQAHESGVDLQLERDFTAAVLDSTEALILVVDSAGLVVRVNHAVERLSGYTAGELVGHPPWGTVLSPDDRHAIEVLAAGEGGALATPIELDWVTASGERCTVAWTSARLVPSHPDSSVVMTGIDVTGRRRYQGFLETVLDSTTGTAIVGMDRSGVITLFNRGAERLLGYAAGDVVGRVSPMLFHDDDEVAARAAELGIEVGYRVLVEQAERTLQPERRDWTFVRLNGSRITVSLTISTMRSAGGVTTGYVGVAEDVTERRRAEDAVRQALEHEQLAVERLGELDRMKSDLVASVSHELRTPMTSVLGFTQILASGKPGPLTERQEQLLERVQRNGRRLLSLIEDLLSLSRMEAGARRVEGAPVDLRSVAAEALEVTDESMNGRDLALRPVGLQGDPILVWGDAGQLERVVVNLASNAVKFTPDGGVVTLEVTREEGAGVVRVIDNGTGIAEEDLGRVFEAFYRAPSATRAAIQGTGLGLAIVRSIVDGHGGSVSCRSSVGHGTTFEVRLPLDGSPLMDAER